MSDPKRTPRSRSDTDRRSPSDTSDKTIAYAAKREQRLKVSLPDGKEVKGYISGSDNFHWALVTSDLDIVLVHKSAPMVLIERVTVESEKNAESIRKITGSYRTFVLTAVLGQTPPPS